ncbi:hypothetical protein EJ08DRAFT_647786 [Tothia fuscella]|uniref:PHD-type domain-containing protein n=1 Tax=Tothia fuscella TaxID=1048955 RepID=A0A9P4NUU2_9PEZI|nr:hypothetical protein EJ08DRAFT_647786 [Tothia fuscella]
MSFHSPYDALNGSGADSSLSPLPPTMQMSSMIADTAQQSSMTPPTFAPPPPSNGNGNSMQSGMLVFPAYSSTTAELLARARANAATQPGTPGYEAAREQVLKGMVTSDRLPVPSAAPVSGRGRGRGRGRGAAGARSPAEAGTSSTPGSVSTPVSERGKGKVGRPRGRGRGGGGRGGKRKRSESVEIESDAHDWKAELSDETDFLQGDDSDVSNSYTPLPAKTKSGRAVNKPTSYVPVIPSPSTSTKKRRPYRRNPEAALCKTCQRGHSPNTNQIVFCDGCGVPYHQYCHDPPIDNDVVMIEEKQWFCSTCVRSRENTQAPNADGMVSGEALDIQEKRARLASLPQPRLIDLLLHASSLHPTLSVFPATATQSAPTASIPSPPGSTKPALPPNTDADTTAGAENGEADAIGEVEPYDGYDTDPPAHYPKPGNGIARNLRPESEDLQWLVDDNFEVFSHQTNYGDEATNGNGTGGGVGGGELDGTHEDITADVSMGGTV